jgi:hypothetical protein
VIHLVGDDHADNMEGLPVPNFLEGFSVQLVNFALTPEEKLQNAEHEITAIIILIISIINIRWHQHCNN